MTEEEIRADERKKYASYFLEQSKVCETLRSEATNFGDAEIYKKKSAQWRLAFHYLNNDVASKKEK